jgi:hypothetical protein
MDRLITHRPIVSSRIAAWEQRGCDNPSSRKKKESGGKRRTPKRVRRVADGLDEAIRGIHDFLDGEEVWDEEKADEEVDGDGLAPALQALADILAGDDLAAILTGMRIGESAELRCENGTFELVRDR